MGRPRSMVKIRSLKPELWASQRLGRMSPLARLTFIGLISLADDEGRGRGEARYLLGHLHAYDESVTEADFKAALQALDDGHLVAFYAVDGCRYYALPGWREHQAIDHPYASALPPVPDDHPMAQAFKISYSELIPQSRGINREGTERMGRDGNGKQPHDQPVGLKRVSGNDMALNGGALSPGEVALLQMKYPIRGEYHGVTIGDLEPEYCQWALDHLSRPGPQLRAALEARVKSKKLEGRG